MIAYHVCYQSLANTIFNTYRASHNNCLITRWLELLTQFIIQRALLEAFLLTIYRNVWPLTHRNIKRERKKLKLFVPPFWYRVEWQKRAIDRAFLKLIVANSSSFFFRDESLCGLRFEIFRGKLSWLTIASGRGNKWLIASRLTHARLRD